MGLEDRIRVLVDYDRDSVTVTASLILHKSMEISLDNIQESELDLLTVAKQQVKRQLMEELDGTNKTKI